MAEPSRFRTKLTTLLRRKRPPLTWVALGILVLVWWNLPRSTPVRAQRAEVPPALPALGTVAATEAKDLKTVQGMLQKMQTENETLRKEQEGVRREMQQERQQTQQREAETRAKQEQVLAKVGEMQERAAQEQKGILERILSAAKTEAQHKTAAAAKQGTPTPAPAVRTPALPAAPVPSTDSVTLRTVKPDGQSTLRGSPPPLDSDQTAYLQTGCMAPAKVVTGVLAASKANGALPMLLSITQPFTCPWMTAHDGLPPRPTGIALQGCFWMGKAEANLGMGRALGELFHLSCVFPDKKAFEKPLKGYLVGVDGTLGVIGRVETRDSAVLARFALTSLLAGFADAMRLAKQTVIVTPYGGTATQFDGNIGQTAAFAGLANVAANASAFYLEQARNLLPVIWVESGVSAWVVVMESTPLDGLPTDLTLVARR